MRLTSTVLGKAIVTVAAILILLASEYICRYVLGVGSPPLIEIEDGFEYRFKPNQSTVQLGRRIAFNSLGMRSPESPTGRYDPLCIGNAVTYGGPEIDQSETYPNQLQEILFERGFQGNVGAIGTGGWAISNELGYIRAKGISGARTVVLQISTHDLWQPLSARAGAVAHPSFPTDPPPSALWELFTRYLIPRINAIFQPRRPTGSAAEFRSTESLEARDARRAELLAMRDEVARRGAALVLLFAADVAEVTGPAALRPEVQDFLTWAAAHSLEVIDVRPAWRQALAQGQPILRDDVHPTPAGNRLMAEAVAQRILNPPSAATPAAAGTAKSSATSF